VDGGGGNGDTALVAAGLGSFIGSAWCL
jgi:hypothetical protein